MTPSESQVRSLKLQIEGLRLMFNQIQSNMTMADNELKILENLITPTITNLKEYIDFLEKK